MSILAVGDTTSFSYTGAIDSFKVPISGIYKMVLAGAGGGEKRPYSSSPYPGKGGTTTCYAKLNKGDILYIVVGGRGGTNTGSYGTYTAKGGYNGGAKTSCTVSQGSTTVTGGGGATHVATVSGLLSQLSSNKDSIIAVAGGGGGTTGTYYGDNVSVTSGTDGNKSASGSFGKGTVNGGGGGYAGGKPFKGGSGYVKYSSVVGKLQTYTSAMTSGTTKSNGSCKITLMEKTSSEIYFNGTKIEAAINFNGNTTDKVVFNGNEI